MARKPAACKLVEDLLGVVGELVGDRQDADLLGGEPERERAGEVLDQDAHEPFHAAERGAVDHHRPVRLVVGAGVFEPEPLGQDVVELHGAELPLAADAVADDEVGLGAVERRLAGGFLVGQAHLVEHRADVVLGASPGVAGRPGVLGVVRVVLREPERVVGQAQAS